MHPSTRSWRPSQRECKSDEKAATMKQAWPLAKPVFIPYYPLVSRSPVILRKPVPYYSPKFQPFYLHSSIRLIRLHRYKLRRGRAGEGSFPENSSITRKRKGKDKPSRFSIFDDSTEFGNSVSGVESVGIVHPATPSVPLLLRWLFTKVYRVAAASSRL